MKLKHIVGVFCPFPVPFALLETKGGEQLGLSGCLSGPLTFQLLPVSGPLHRLYPLPGALFLLLFTWLAPAHPNLKVTPSGQTRLSGLCVHIPAPQRETEVFNKTLQEWPNHGNCQGSLRGSRGTMTAPWSLLEKG